MTLFSEEKVQYTYACKTETYAQDFEFDDYYFICWTKISVKVSFTKKVDKTEQPKKISLISCLLDGTFLRKNNQPVVFDISVS